MSRVSLSPWYIINLIGRLGLRLPSPVLLGTGPRDITDVQGVADIFGRSDGSCLYFRELIDWREGVVSKTVSSELDTLGGGALDISDIQIGLWLVQTDVQGSRG